MKRKEYLLDAYYTRVFDSTNRTYAVRFYLLQEGGQNKGAVEIDKARIGANTELICSGVDSARYISKRIEREDIVYSEYADIGDNDTFYAALITDSDPSEDELKAILTARLHATRRDLKALAGKYHYKKETLGFAVEEIGEWKYALYELTDGGKDRLVLGYDNRSIFFLNIDMAEKFFLRGGSMQACFTSENEAVSEFFRALLFKALKEESFVTQLASCTELLLVTQDADKLVYSAKLHLSEETYEVSSEFSTKCGTFDDNYGELLREWAVAALRFGKIKV